jgi:hypothetical protein
MVYRGHVENGAIRLDGSVVLPEGTEVRVEVAAPAQEPAPAKEEVAPNATTIEDKLRAIWADVSQEEWDRLPADLSEHLDHYIYGTPK